MAQSKAMALKTENNRFPIDERTSIPAAVTTTRTIIWSKKQMQLREERLTFTSDLLIRRLEFLTLLGLLATRNSSSLD